MPDALMISGYCKCGFPAAYRCPKCREKLCGNCLPKHVCDTGDEKIFDQSEAVQSMTRKPGRPKIRK